MTGHTWPRSYMTSHATIMQQHTAFLPGRKDSN